MHIERKEKRRKATLKELCMLLQFVLLFILEINGSISVMHGDRSHLHHEGLL